MLETGPVDCGETTTVPTEFDFCRPNIENSSWPMFHNSLLERTRLSINHVHVVSMNHFPGKLQREVTGLLG